MSAAPSFVLALQEYDDSLQIFAMLAGIGCFIAAYTLVSCTSWAKRLRRKPFVVDTLKIGYGTRIILSFLGGCGTFTVAPTVMPDLYIGAACIDFVNEVLGLPNSSTLMVFTTTVLVGSVWNAILLVYMSIIYGIQRAFRAQPLPANVCKHCGYDLRASAQRCPECGTPIVG